MMTQKTMQLFQDLTRKDALTRELAEVERRIAENQAWVAGYAARQSSPKPEGDTVEVDGSTTDI